MYCYHSCSQYSAVSEIRVFKKDIEDSNNKEKPVCFRFTLVVLRSKELFVYVTNTNGAREELERVHNKQVQ
jgi:hypothetical protein